MKKIIGTLVFSCASLGMVSAIALADDTPNTPLEKKLNRVYKKYNLKKTDPELWEYARSQAGIKSYTTQKGETLWEVSEVIFGDANFWPKIWSLNKNILNPHQVPPGSVLTFTGGSFAEAPGMDIAEGVKLPEASPEVLALTANVQLPEPQHVSKPALVELPTSLPKWKFRQDTQVAVHLDVSKRVGFVGDAVKNLSLYAADASVEGAGEVVGTEGDTLTAAEFQYLYVRLENPPPDKKMMAVQNLYKIDEVDNHPAGEIIRVDGEIEVGDLVNPEKKIYRAMVRKSLHPIDIGDRVMPGTLPTMTIGHADTPVQINSTVCWGILDKGTSLFGTEAMLVLDQGRKAGLLEGQTVALFQKQSLRRDDDIEIANSRQVGLAKVVRVSEHFSTAMVIEQKEPVQVGDTTMPGSGLAAQAPQFSVPSPERPQAPEMEAPMGKADDLLKDMDKPTSDPKAKPEADPLTMPSDEKSPAPPPEDDLKLE